MDIALFSMQNSISQVKQAISLTLMKKTMDMANIETANLLSTIEASTPPIDAGNIGHLLNVKA